MNHNFGGISGSGNKNVFPALKYVLQKELIGVGCPAHIHHNCMQHGADTMSVDIVECTIMEIYNYFYTYTAITEDFKSNVNSLI